MNLATFADDMRARAAKVPQKSSGRFGRFKVFIAALGLDNDGKERLVEAHRAGLLRLCRADMIPMMDRGVVLASETNYLNATFHFLDTEGT